MKKRQKINVEDFIKTWQKANGVAEVMAAFPGYKPVSLSVKAGRLRRKGVSLQRFCETYNYAELAEIAKKAAKK